MGWALALLGAADRSRRAVGSDARATPDPAELDQRVRVLERKLELAEEQAAEKAKTAPVGDRGSRRLRAQVGRRRLPAPPARLVQTDARFYVADDERPLNDTLVVRRARPILDGTLWKIVDFRLMSDFGGGSSTLVDAYLDLKLSRALRVRAGKAKVPVGLEALLEDASLLFVERGLPSLLAPVRDVGVQVTGEPWGGRLQYAAGVFNGAPDGATGDGDNADDKDVAARFFVRPFQRPAGEAAPPVSLGFGVAASFGEQSGTASAPNLPAFRTAGQQTFFSYRTDGTAAGTVIADGERTRIAPQGWLYSGPWLVLAEWTESRQEVRRDAERAELTHRAWQVVGSWAITGEDVTERGLAPRRAVRPRGGRARRAAALPALRQARGRPRRLPALRRPDALGRLRREPRRQPRLAAQPGRQAGARLPEHPLRRRRERRQPRDRAGRAGPLAARLLMSEPRRNDMTRNGTALALWLSPSSPARSAPPASR